MKFEKPTNENYCATVVEIKEVFPLKKCDNIIGTTIFGNPVIVGKDTKPGTIGLFFPAETQLADEFTKANNLYRHSEFNSDPKAVGMLENNRRIRAIKLRGNPSAGLFLPISCMSYLGIGPEQFKVGDSFDRITSNFSRRKNEVCCKYILPVEEKRLPGNRKERRALKFSKAVHNQFRFHQNTAQLSKNIQRIEPDDIISITKKLHGTSAVFSKVLCKKPRSKTNRLVGTVLSKITTWIYGFLNAYLLDWAFKDKYPIKLRRPVKWFSTKVINECYRYIHTNIVSWFFHKGTHYDYLYSSRKALKNDRIDEITFSKIADKHFYKSDIWGLAFEKVKGLLKDGMTIYAEIVGFIPNSGEYIQKDYDYGCGPHTFEVYVYRITYTNPSGDVFEFSARQVQQWCSEHGVKAVPELYYGRANRLFYWENDYCDDWDGNLDFPTNLLNLLKQYYLEKDCDMCRNKVPDEGVVVRREVTGCDAYKLRSFRFLERETKLLDAGETNIEDNQPEVDSDDAVLNIEDVCPTPRAVQMTVGLFQFADRTNRKEP